MCGPLPIALIDSDSSGRLILSEFALGVLGKAKGLLMEELISFGSRSSTTGSSELSLQPKWLCVVNWSSLSNPSTPIPSEYLATSDLFLTSPSLQFLAMCPCFPHLKHLVGNLQSLVKWPFFLQFLHTLGRSYGFPWYLFLAFQLPLNFFFSFPSDTTALTCEPFIA